MITADAGMEAPMKGVVIMNMQQSLLATYLASKLAMVS
jgi:hypothetical protein